MMRYNRIGLHGLLRDSFTLVYKCSFQSFIVPFYTQTSTVAFAMIFYVVPVSDKFFHITRYDKLYFYDILLHFLCI
jgi:hypothetical protein